MTPQNRELEWFAALVHGAMALLHALFAVLRPSWWQGIFLCGALAGLHGLAAIFGWKLGRKVDRHALLHAGAFFYSVLSARRHGRRLSERS